MNFVKYTDLKRAYIYIGHAISSHKNVQEKLKGPMLHDIGPFNTK